MHILYFQEHKEPNEDQKDSLDEFKSLRGSLELTSQNKGYIPIENLRCLGIIDDGKGNLKAGYYIGASWYKESDLAFVVKPKVDVDYLKMFMTAMENTSVKETEYFSNYYHIDLDQSAIEAESLDNVITPLLILHYLTLLKHLVSKGLKKGYVIQEQNFQSKVKGRFFFQKHLTKNVFAKREDRAYCRFQEFTKDIPENRLLKKALIFSVRFLTQSNIKDVPKISNIENAFENVSENVSLVQVNKIKLGKIFRHYDSALKVAKLILRYFDYSIDNVKKDCKKVRPFWIDMPRLYEMYVLSVFRKAYGEQIKFQVDGYRKSKVDFIKKGDGEKIILDAKYKDHYDDGNKGILEDIREISGYARDQKILNALNWDCEKDSAEGIFSPKCVIVYPVPIQEKNEETNELDNKCEVFKPDGGPIIHQCKTEIKWFRGFYKLAVLLPKSKSAILAK